MTTLFGSWLSETDDLQRTAYGRSAGDQSDVSLWLEYVRQQTLAAFVELGEFVQNVRWKPWAREKRAPNVIERGRAVEELVDVLHFVANLLVALGVDDVELNGEYARKIATNRKRMTRGGH